MLKRNFVALVAMATAAGLMQSHGWAAPYAAQITESGGNVNYILNEAADEVIIVRDGVETTVGPLSAGPQSFARSGAGTFQIIARKNSSAGYLTVDNNAEIFPTTPTGTVSPQAKELQVGDAYTNVSQQFEFPRDVTINTNPATPSLFGLTYIPVARNGTTGTDAGATPRVVTQGIYALNADRTAALGTETTAATGGLTFNSASSSDLYRTALDVEGNLYISDWSDATGSVSTLDASLTAGGAVLVGVGSATDITPSATLNHGSISGIALRGSATAGDLKLFTLDEDIVVNNAVRRYDLNGQRLSNSTLPVATGARPLLAAVVIADLEQGLGGRLYLAQNNFDGVQLGLAVVSADGASTLYNSLTDSALLGIDGNTTVNGQQDAVRRVQGIGVSPDGKWLAAATNIRGDTFVIPLIEGIPDIANRAVLDAFETTSATNTSRDAEFDAANNLYIANNTSEQVKVFSPGGPSYSVYDSAGTFRVINGPVFEGSGTYGDGTKWLGGAAASGPETLATVGAMSSGSQAITVDADVSLGKLTFAGGNYTVGGAASINFGTGVGAESGFDSYIEGRVIAESGNHVINAPVRVTKNFGVAAYTGSSLALNNVTFASGNTTTNGTFTIQKFGGGQVAMPVFSQKQLVIRAGTLKFNSATSAGAAKVKQLNIAGTAAAPTATLDLGSAGLVLDYDAPVSPAVSPMADVDALLAAGRAGGNGIVSSAAATNARLTVAAAEATALPATLSAGSFMGQAIDDTSILIRTTLRADTDLDGNVNFADLVKLAQNYNGTGKTFLTGDFNYDGAANFADLVTLAQNYNQTYAGGSSISGAAVSGASFQADWALAQSLVPEPTSLSLLGLGAVAMVRRRR